VGEVVVFRSRSRRPGPLRFFWYVSDTKLDMLLSQVGEPAWRRVTAELDVDVKLVGLTLGFPNPDRSLAERSRAAKVLVVEECIRQRHGIGDLSASRGYVAGETEMAWRPCTDGETVLFSGHADDVLITLGGSVGNLLGHPPDTGHTGSHPYAIRAALADGGTAHDIATDVRAAAAAIDGTPAQPVRFLALVISRGPLPVGAAHPDYLLATPLYVEAAGDPGL
jgi:hypothetical protein